MKKSTKIVLILVSVLAIIAVLVIVFISPITKYAVEKYDKQFTGRQITMDWAYVNPFSGYIHFNNVQIREFESDSIFIKMDGMSAHFKVLKLLSKTVDIEEIILDKPIVTVIQSRKFFNFNDLIELFASPKNGDTPSVKTAFRIPRIKINDGAFYYREKVIPINYFIKKVNIEITEKRLNVDTLDAKFSFIPGVGSGDVKGNFTINLQNRRYRFGTIVHKLDLQLIEQYLKDLSHYGRFTANLDADMTVIGNFNDKRDVSTTGLIALNDFHFGKTTQEDYASFTRLAIGINELSPKKGVRLFDSVVLRKPYFKYERYDKMDNLQMMFGKKGSMITAVKADAEKFNLIIEIAKHIKILSRNFFQSYYQLNRLAVYDGDLKFNDFATSEKFSVNLSPFYISADSIDKNNRRADIYLKSGLEPYGNAKITLSINPKDTGDFDMNYHFQKLPATLFNPYVISYTSFPLDRGTIEFNGQWKVRNGEIQGQNHLIVIDPRLAKRIKNDDTKRLPTPLIMAFVRERGNVIDYDIPLTGSLKNPKFHLEDAIFDLISNIFVKPVTIPYGIKVKTTEAKIEQLLTLSWPMRSTALSINQTQFMGKMADFLKKTPDAALTIQPQLYSVKEKEYLLFFEAKKKYFLTINNRNNASFSADDSAKVSKMSVKDAAFVAYLDKKMDNDLLFTIQDKCAKFVDSDFIDVKYKQLNASRATLFMDFFKEKGLDKQIKMAGNKSMIPYNGFSYYQIIYKGTFPEDLVAAYQKLDALDEEAPRKKFIDVREKTGGILNFFFKNRQARLERRALKKEEKEKEAAFKKSN